MNNNENDVLATLTLKIIKNDENNYTYDMRNVKTGFENLTLEKKVFAINGLLHSYKEGILFNLLTKEEIRQIMSIS